MVPFREIATASPLAMPRNDRVLRTEKKKFCLLAKNGVIDLRFLFYPVQRALCHCERSVAISRKGYHIIMT